MDGLIHSGMGSDLMALCGKMFGISGHDQVRLSYVDNQVTCVDCLRIRIKELRKKLEVTVPATPATPQSAS